MSLTKIGCVGALSLAGFVLTLEEAESENIANEAAPVVESVANLDATRDPGGLSDDVARSDDAFWDDDSERDADPEALKGLIETTMSAYQLSGVFLNRATEDTAIINGVVRKEGDYLSVFQSDFQVLEILQDSVVIRGSLVVGETDEQTFKLILSGAQMQQVEEPVDVEAPADWLEAQLTERKQ